MEWLLEFIGDQIDPKQFGGEKGVSTTHYLTEFINFIHYNLDFKNSNAVLAAAIDFSKAFNRVSHNVIIEKLAEMGVPGWLLRVIIGFLENRFLEVSYKGAISERKAMPGGGPAGTILGMFLFVILINPIGFSQPEKNWECDN